MRSRLASARLRRAFTLIELIVVLGLITAMGGILGLALHAAEPGTAAAQRTLFSLAQGLRGQAALKGEKHAMLVVGGPADDGMLQRIAYATEVEGVERGWLLTGRVEALPKNVYFVPAADHPLVGTRRPVTLTGGAAAWEKLFTKGLEKKQTEAKERITVYERDTLTGARRVARATYYKIFEAKPDGKLKIDAKVVLASAHLTGPNQLVFDTPEAVVGFESSDYGAPQFLSGPDEFR